jgi:non-heme chloroperoxidase
MPSLTAGGVDLFYRDWGAGRPVVFLHSLLMDSTMWQHQLLHLAERGYRAIAFDRRGHGRSDDPGRGYDYNTLADDLACVIDTLDLTEATLVGHSMGGGEIVRYLTRHGAGRVSQIALVGSTVPSLDIAPEAVKAVLAAVRLGYGRWVSDNAAMSFGRKPPAIDIPQVEKERTIRDWMAVSLIAALKCQEATFEADFSEELAAIDVPALVIHGDDDTVAPLDRCGRRSADLLRNATLQIYRNASHMIHLSHRVQLNSDLLRFVGTEQ